MKKYVLLYQKIFESNCKFEDRLNDECRKGYRPISLSSSHNTSRAVVLLEKLT